MSLYSRPMLRHGIRAALLLVLACSGAAPPTGNVTPSNDHDRIAASNPCTKESSSSDQCHGICVKLGSSSQDNLVNSPGNRSRRAIRARSPGWKERKRVATSESPLRNTGAHVLLAAAPQLLGDDVCLPIKGRLLFLDLRAILSLKILQDLLTTLARKSIEIDRAVPVHIDHYRDNLLLHSPPPIARRIATGSVVRSGFV